MSTGDNVLALLQWIDNSEKNWGRDPEAVLWSRVTKVCEESGEVWRALSAWIGENSRKGVHGSADDVIAELLDTASAALAAVVHIHGNSPDVDVMAMLEARTHATVLRAAASTPNSSGPDDA
jgi:hypothetical protein